jgi:hypothetical protein
LKKAENYSIFLFYGQGEEDGKEEKEKYGIKDKSRIKLLSKEADTVYCLCAWAESDHDVTSF